MWRLQRPQKRFVPPLGAATSTGPILLVSFLKYFKLNLKMQTFFIFRYLSYFSKNSQKTSFFGHFWRFWVTENIFFKNFFPSYCELFRKTFAIYGYNRYLCMLEKYDLTTNMQGQGNIVGEVPKTLDFWGEGGPPYHSQTDRADFKVSSMGMLGM